MGQKVDHFHHMIAGDAMQPRNFGNGQAGFGLRPCLQQDPQSIISVQGEFDRISPQIKIYSIYILKGPAHRCISNASYGGSMTDLPIPQNLSEKTIATVKATAPALQKYGLQITQRMYERLFMNEDIKQMFDQAAQESGEQPKRLAAAILAYAQNADKLQNLTGPVERMVIRHVETGVRPEHYPYVADALLPAIKDVLGEAATDEILAAWGEAYWFLAGILIAKESELYETEEITPTRMAMHSQLQAGSAVA